MAFVDLNWQGIGAASIADWLNIDTHLFRQCELSGIEMAEVFSAQAWRSAHALVAAVRWSWQRYLICSTVCLWSVRSKGEIITLPSTRGSLFSAVQSNSMIFFGPEV